MNKLQTRYLELIYFRRCHRRVAFQSKQRHETQIHLRNLDSHDTNEGEITGQIKNISVAMEHTIEHVIKKQVISVLPDGFCLFRALGKNHNIHPGEVIKYMKNKCIKMKKKT